MISPLTSASLRGGRQRSCVDAGGRSAQRAEGHGMPRGADPRFRHPTPPSLPAHPMYCNPSDWEGSAVVSDRQRTRCRLARQAAARRRRLAGLRHSVRGAISTAAAGRDGSIWRNGKPRPRTEAERRHPTGRRPMPLHPHRGKAAWTCGTGGSSTAAMAGASARLVPSTVGYGNWPSFQRACSCRATCSSCSVIAASFSKRRRSRCSLRIWRWSRTSRCSSSSWAWRISRGFSLA